MFKNFTESQVEALLAMAMISTDLRRAEAQLAHSYKQAQADPRSATLELQQLHDERQVYALRGAQRNALERLDQQLLTTPLHNKARRVALRSQTPEVYAFVLAN